MGIGNVGRLGRLLSTTFKTFALHDLIHKSSRKRRKNVSEQKAGFVTPDWLTKRQLS